MPTFVVTTREVHKQDVVINADNEWDAIKRVENGEGNTMTTEYDYTLESDTWGVTQEE